MKKKLLFVIAACAFFLPATVFAKEPEYKPAEKVFYANGTAITIEARTDGEAGALIKWDGKEEAVAADTSVFGGSHNSDEVIENASIIMNGGTIRNIIGGGLHKSITKNVTITLNNGTVTSVQGGGAHHFHKTGDGDFINSSVAEAKNRDTAVTIVDKAIVTINGGTVTSTVFGGGESYSYTGEATVIVNGGKIGWLTAGGSNGYTNTGKLEIYGGEITVVQGVNRGEMETVKTKVEGGKITRVLYAGGETVDNEVTGKINGNIELTVLDGDITKIEAGTSGGPQSPATDLIEAEINSKFEDKIGQDFNEDATTVTVNLMLIAEDEEQTIQIPKGTVFTDEELKAMIEEINNELAADNLELVGFYLDEKLTQEFDFSTPIEQDMELYMKLKDITPEQKVENPETSDVNIFLILSLVAVGAFGTTLVLKNRLS